MTTITRLRERHSHPATTARKIAEVEQLARAYQDLRRETAQRYWGPEHLPLVLRRPKQATTDRRHSGEAAANPLASHYQAQAVLDGLGAVRGSWEQAFAAVRSRAARKFGDPERHEINWLLRWPEHLVTILDGGVVVPADKDGTPVTDLVDNDHARLDRWLAQTLRAARPGQPKLRRRLALEADNSLFSVRTRPGSRFPVWVSLTGIEHGRRLRLPMAGSDTEFLDGTANLRISVESDTKGRRRIVFRRAAKIEVTERAGTETVGIDKGANIAIAATSSDPEHAVLLGPELGEVLARRSGRSFRRQRSRFASAADNLAGRHTPGGRFHGNPHPTAAQRRQAQRIRHHNLGSIRREAEERRAQAEVRNTNGRAARELVETFPDASTFYEEKLNFRGADQRRPAKTNRKLNRWAKAQLSKAIDLHVSASGARRQFVTAAYTSQECPRCHWTDRGNRKDISFRCSHCEYRGHADAVASSNVRSRGSDQTITLYTPFRVVKETLLMRHATTDARCASRGLTQNDPPTVLGALLLDEQPF